MRELKNNVDMVKSIDPAVQTSNPGLAGVDLQGFESSIAFIYPGTITDGTHTPKLQESDDNSVFTDVSASDMDGSFANIATNTIQRVGYKGNKRYVRLFVTVSGASTGGIYGAGIVRGVPHHAPVA